MATDRNGLPANVDKQPPDAADRSGDAPERREPPMLPIHVSTRGLVGWGIYVLLILVFSVVLAPLSSMWWLVLVFGSIVPITWAVLAARSTARSPAPSVAPPVDKERQLLDALAKRGELTPTTAALQTALTVGEAEDLLDRLASRGYLKAWPEDGVMVYALFERDRAQLLGPRAGSDGDATASPQLPKGATALVEPLSEREIEVLRLLASGRTNAEIANELYVAVGTIKAHVNNIYRKLEVRNRTEALARARDLGLLT